MKYGHTVPHQAGELAFGSLGLTGSHKKPRYEVKDAGNNVLTRGSVTKPALWGKEATYYPYMKDGSFSMLEGKMSQASNVVVPALSSTDCNSRDTSLPYQDLRISDYCVDESGMFMHRSMFRSEDPAPGMSVSTTQNRSGFSSLNGQSSDFTDLSISQNKRKDRESDLVYNDWPDISNFDDIDKILRDCTFGEGQVGIADDLSWLLSFSNTNYASDIGLETCLQSAGSELGALHMKLEPQCSEHNLTQNSADSADHGKPFTSFYAGWPGTDAQTKGCSAIEEKLCDRGDNMQNMSLSQISNECYSDGSRATTVKLKDKETKQTTAQMQSVPDVSDVLASQVCSSQQFSEQNHFIVSSSSYMHTLGHSSQLEFGLPTHQCAERLPNQFYTAQIMAPKMNTGKVHQRQQLCRTVKQPSEQPSFQYKATDQKKQLGDGSEMEDISIQLPTFKIDHPKLQKVSSLNSVFSDDIFEKATSFQQLQDVTHQLDIRTKLCIRDSLYRLARSAGESHDFAIQNCSGGTINAMENQSAEALMNKLTEFKDARTNTNPIDRSIAHLLFHILRDGLKAC